ncbi:MAG TPA: alpha/beta hydrolase-fold protein [Gaiellaceae bacterium]|nr:alpha/beta hydrolase-fold protein [Gaiellaceae bacterium]
MTWERFRGETVVGDVRVLRGAAERELFAYLPGSHGGGARFPVVYMLDGQNLFDDATAHSGTEWRVDETMEELAREGIEAIVVGIPAAPGDERGHEYSGAKIEQHLSFVVETVRPLVEASFDVDPRRERTGIAGSSLGGVASLHAVYSRPETFGFAAVLSPAFWWTGDDRCFQLVERTVRPDARIYIDVGDSEMPEDEATRRRYVEGFDRMTALLRSRGFDDGSLRAVLQPGGAHFETDWARRLPDALRFLLAA